MVTRYIWQTYAKKQITYVIFKKIVKEILLIPFFSYFFPMLSEFAIEWLLYKDEKGRHCEKILNFYIQSIGIVK